MTKGLEELKILKFLVANCSHFEFDFTNIEKELKEYEEMKAIKGTTTFDKAIEDTLINACPNVAKKVKALEIIKAMNFIRVYETLGGDFVLEAVNDGIKMTKDNYDLLKEVLL